MECFPYVVMIFFAMPLGFWPQDFFMQFVCVGWMLIGVFMLGSSFAILIDNYQQLRGYWIRHSRDYYEDQKGGFTDFEVLPPWEKGLVLCGNYLKKILKNLK